MRRNVSKKSTNPFDEDDDGDDNGEEDNNEVFHDAQQEPPKRRSAPLNFDNPFDGVEEPALRFDQVRKLSTEFLSPLESAMQQLASSPPTGSAAAAYGYPTSNAIATIPLDNDDDLTEATPLLQQPNTSSGKKSPHVGKSPRRHGIPTEISTSAGGPSPSRFKPSPMTKTNRKRRPSQTKGGAKVVLTELASGDNEFTMDYKYILLEDLGTASSWLILLLPYVTFVLALLLESSKSLKVTTLGPLAATASCVAAIASKESFSPGRLKPCHAPFLNGDWDPIHYQLSEGKYNTTLSPSSGVVFDSGDLSRIPVLSTEIFGDAEFQRLTSPVVALVSQGLVESSVIVLQQSLEQKSDQWMLMFSSKPKTLAMACQRNLEDDELWDCQSPRVVNVVFSMPDSAVYAGGNLRVNVFYSLKTTPTDSTLSSKDDVQTTTVYTKSKQDSSELQTTGIRDPNSLLESLVASSSYTFEHMSDLAMGLDTGVRLCTFAVSFWFVIYWCYCMGVHVSCSLCGRQKKKDSLWWESPWILFPERWYIVILLISLLLMQEPVLAIMTFFPSLGSSTRLHVAADATIGIGVQGVLFVYLCLFHGLPFHTAAITKRRTEHQRQMLQLRRAAKYVAKSEHPLSPTEANISDYVSDYFDRFGDVDGSASPAFLRLGNDPCGDGWADFLFFKLLLLLLGIASVIGTAYCRFPPDDHDDAVGLSDSMIRRYKWAYISCIFVQFATVVIWMLSIIVAAIVAGRKLRKEPFLGTRPAQLVYRILLAHVSLGFLVLSLGFGTNFSQVLKKWSPNITHQHEQIASAGDDERSKLELILRVLSGVAQQFPYNGTAASVGSGKVLFATVSILITAFIFLPAHILDEDTEEAYVETWGTTWTTTLNDKLHEKRRLRRDKRLVINLARDSRTWRVFPLPIKQSAVSTTMLQDNVFQLYQDLSTDGNTKGRGVVSVGPYTPVFCLEIACWLNEASWQAYYTPAGITPSDPDVPAMHLEGIGLRLEGAVYDESTDTQAYVATNLAAQVDGEEDTIIVVAFRGSTSPTNLQTDLKSRQVPLLDQLAGIGLSAFSIFTDRVEVNDNDGWIWDTPEPEIKESLQCVVAWVSPKPTWVPGICSRNEEDSKLSAVSKGARRILQATPVARDSFPLVHDGFQEVYSHIRRKLLDILLPVLQRQLSRVVTEGQSEEERVPLALPKIYCTGHSLGGSLAQLLALDLANNCGIMLPTQLSSKLEHFYDAEMGGKPSNPSKTSESTLRLQPPIAVYTFGQPRIGNKAFSRLYKQRVPHTFRVVNEGDAITSMPNRLFCGGVYKHSGLEVLLDEGQTGNILVGPTVVETLFRFHQMRTSVLAHTMQRYRDCLECAFAQDELLEYYRGHNLVAGNVIHRTNEVALVAPADIPEWMTNLRSRTL